MSMKDLVEEQDTVDSAKKGNHSQRKCNQPPK
jgi:hypothetical protein